MLSAGSRLGSYEVIALLGVGGMGEVYRAHDPRLGRDVALKILPQNFASDPERLARFKREAQVLASITHPNIGAIFGLEDNVVDGARVEALVLELVEGQTLAERISQGRIPLEEALPIARQIAEALEAAHAKGIIHRDLKPANVKITPGGIVKVLDFGLAKLAEPEAAASGTAPSGFSISPTITSPAATGLGVVLGTAAYMSPEQAKGRPADKYCDMWAFGAVLYEMLSGRRAFEGEDVGETLAEVIKANVHWDALPVDTPSAIRRLLRRCLVKDRKARISDAGVARLEIDEGLNELRGPSVAPRAEAPPSQWYRLLVPVAAAVVTAAATGISVWEFARSDSPPAPVPTRFTIELPQDVRLAGNTVQRVAITRDGRRLIYNGIRGLSSQLYVRSLDQLQSLAIPGVEGLIGAMFVSPDGEWVGYNDVRDAKFKKVRISGGPPATICDNPGPGAAGFRGASWGSSGTIVFATIASPALMQVSDAGGTPQPLTKPQNGEVHSFPQFLPDGRALLFTISRQGMSDRVAVVRLDDRQPRVLLAGSSPRFAESGHIVFVRERALWAVPFDRDRLAVAGEAVPVLEGIAERPTPASPSSTSPRTAPWCTTLPRQPLRRNGLLCGWTGRDVKNRLPRPRERTHMHVFRPTAHSWPSTSGIRKTTFGSGISLAARSVASPSNVRSTASLCGRLTGDGFFSNRIAPAQDTCSGNPLTAPANPNSSLTAMSSPHLACRPMGREPSFTGNKTT